MDEHNLYPCDTITYLKLRLFVIIVLLPGILVTHTYQKCTVFGNENTFSFTVCWFGTFWYSYNSPESSNVGIHDLVSNGR